MNKNQTASSYWRLLRKRFKNNRKAVWSFRILLGLVVLSILVPIIANDKPIYARIDNERSYPIFQEIAEDWGVQKASGKFLGKNWYNEKYQSVVWPLIPYSDQTQDFLNTSAGPFEKQNVSSIRFWHWLGTDQIGRDVLAGMLYGTRVAFTVGILAMALATIIGLFFGILAGFFGDNTLYVSRGKLITISLSFIASIFYGFIARSFVLSGSSGYLQILISLLIVTTIIGLGWLIGLGFERSILFKKAIKVPVDIWVMRIVEIFNAIPTLILLLAIVAIINKPSIYNIILIIGLIRWTTITRFVRAELLRIRQLEYVEAARALGYSRFRIIFRHALPNALGAALIAISFGIATAILLEATLSFLGIGMPPDKLTWGLLLSEARSNTSAWWLVIFPGLAIFSTVILFNLLGEGLSDALSSNESA